VPTGGARRGRRDNGLSAAEYAAVGDVDPRVGEHLLDVLAVAGIAAYLQPATDLHPITRTTTLPARPTDRLFADRAHLDTAREYLSKLRTEAAAEGPVAGPRESEDPSTARTEPGPLDVDAAWARIVADFNAEGEPSTPTWPARENLVAEPEPRPAAEQPSLLDALDTFGADLPDADDDEGYTPPPPPPLPRPSRAAVLGFGLVLAGLVVFLAPDLLPVSGDMALLIGLSALLGGFVTLIWRLRGGDDEDTDPDDGAVV
jgi:hypothetical protein